ncbi:sensor histidine kinase [Amycolatopsis saalfeldensis]|uniref:histidine kinase n=1 Tax=Amycolatopsis saalfeldensis TaxID=394193 RepID=A0A1H8VMK9_9PSEU|nr:histidine kinase [Amycolatopsis saalfeldensis]SEP16118.1 Histidine kinase [Amycolatopsis saalfeldensis]
MITLRRGLEFGLRFRGGAWYIPIGLLLVAGSLVPALHHHGTVFGGLPDRPYDVLAVVAIAAQGLPLTVCRRWPVTCLVLVSLGFLVDQLRGYHSFAGSALPLALLNTGSRLQRHRRVTVLAFSSAYVAAAITFSSLGPGETLEDYVMFYLALALAWTVGRWLRSTRAAEAERRRRVAEDSRAAERARIAHELHDVVTHHVTAMVVQSEAARYLTGAPERLDQALTVVTDTGRQAITDLRRLLDVLDPGHGTPSSAELRPLVEQAREAGQPVEFTEEGTPVGNAGPVAYRVVQEALTNALKYAHGSRTSVQVRYRADETTVEINTDESVESAAALGGSGRGLAGLRERVGVLGGDFSAGRSGNGFSVRARIPEGNRP